MVGNRRVFMVMYAALLCTSCAASHDGEERRRTVAEDIETILSEPLEAGYTETQRCLSGHEYRDFRVIDDQHILFEGRREQLWLNTLRMRCPDLRHATVLRVRSISIMGRICDMDTFEAGDWFDWPWYRRWPWRWGTRWGTGMPCHLGKFQPVTAAQVAAIKAALETTAPRSDR